MILNHIQTDRAGGVLLGQAIGDALGVPYEFGPKIGLGEPRMVGGGLGPYAPGEWSDDTQMAVCIARVAATEADLTSADALDAIAEGFIDWAQHGASDIGNQTRTVLTHGRHGAERPAARLKAAAAAETARSGSAGNGALMRTAIVGLCALDDPQRTALAARRVAALTHPDRRCQESALLWSEAVRLAVVEGRLELRPGLRLLDREGQDRWTRWIDQAEQRPPASFTPNGYTVTALQAAWSAIWSTRDIAGPDQVEAALRDAIAIGDDTDTVAAIAGGLLGAYYGVSGLPTELARRVHGWPGLRGRDLVGLALATATPVRAGRQHGRWCR